jgi:cysteine desulfurase / selenocysteine lyase
MENIVPSANALNITRIRQDFPILHQEVNGQPLVYLDNAASSQKPIAVIESIREYYMHTHANIHRGAHYLAQKATTAYEGGREKVRAHLNASSVQEIIFTSGTTDAINLVAQTWARQNITAGDRILVSALEHHSNLVPWQMVSAEKRAHIDVIDLNEDGSLDLESYRILLEKAPKLVAFNHVSNALGTINPAKEMISMAHAAGAKVLVDGAQAMPHMKVDVQDLDADFYAFSGHKVYGPTGIGILYGKAAILDKMPPYRGGGEMIKSVSYDGFTVNELPYKFEAGTPHIEGGIALGVALDYVNQLGLEAIAKHENELLKLATSKITAMDGVQIYGTTPHKAGVLSFLVDGIHPYDLGTLMDQMGIAVRTGHHCAEPLMNKLGITGTVRASFAVYNTATEVDRFVYALERALQMLR